MSIYLVKLFAENTRGRMAEVLDEAFKKLTEIERKIMNCRYYNSMTQSKTAQILNMTQVQVSRAEKRILLKLKGILK